MFPLLWLLYFTTKQCKCNCLPTGPTYKWIAHSIQNAILPNAVNAGPDSDGSPIYFGRTIHEGEQLAVKVIPTNKYAAICYKGKEIPKSSYEVINHYRLHKPLHKMLTVLINISVCFQLLCGTGFTWIASSNGDVPDGAVRTGCLPTGEPLYVGRAVHNGSFTPGKIIRSQGCLYFPYGHIEHRAQQYEVLVHSGTDQLAVAPNPVSYSLPLRLPERARLANRPVMERPLFDPITFGTRNIV